MSPPGAFTLFHVLLSLIGIFAGALLLIGLCSHILRRQAATVFLIATGATSITGFMFPFRGITPGIIIGIVSLPAPLLATFSLRKGWAISFAISSAFAEYLNVVVLITQLFSKIPLLHSLGQNSSGLAIGVAQFLNLTLFTGTAIVAARQKVRGWAQ